MTPEELMKPRWKVIASYPDCNWRVGAILDRDWGWDGNDEEGFAEHVSDFPHLFRRLEWWEDREPEDMPEYIKVISKGMMCNAVAGGVYKVHKHFSSSYGEPNKKGTQIFGDDYISYSRTVPATETEYNEYIQKKEANNG